MAADERVDMRKGRRHAAGERSEAWRGCPRIGPDDPMRVPAERDHLAGEDARVVALPTVGDDQHYGTAGHPPPPIEIHEVAHRATDARATRPVGHQCRCAFEREVGIGVAQRASQPSESRPEHEHLGMCAGCRTPEQVQVGAGVRLHRPGDVEKRNEATRCPSAGTPDRHSWVPTRARAVA